MSNSKVFRSSPLKRTVSFADQVVPSVQDNPFLSTQRGNLPIAQQQNEFPLSNGKPVSSKNGSPAAFELALSKRMNRKLALFIVLFSMLFTSLLSIYQFTFHFHSVGSLRILFGKYYVSLRVTSLLGFLVQYFSFKKLFFPTCGTSIRTLRQSLILYVPFCFSSAILLLIGLTEKLHLLKYCIFAGLVVSSWICYILAKRIHIISIDKESKEPTDFRRVSSEIALECARDASLLAILCTTAFCLASFVVPMLSMISGPWSLGSVLCLTWCVLFLWMLSTQSVHRLCIESTRDTHIETIKLAVHGLSSVFANVRLASLLELKTCVERTEQRQALYSDVDTVPRLWQKLYSVLLDDLLKFKGDLEKLLIILSFVQICQESNATVGDKRAPLLKLVKLYNPDAVDSSLPKINKEDRSDLFVKPHSWFDILFDRMYEFIFGKPVSVLSDKKTTRIPDILAIPSNRPVKSKDVGHLEDVPLLPSTTFSQLISSDWMLKSIYFASLFIGQTSFGSSLIKTMMRQKMEGSQSFPHQTTSLVILMTLMAASIDEDVYGLVSHECPSLMVLLVQLLKVVERVSSNPVMLPNSSNNTNDPDTLRQCDLFLESILDHIKALAQCFPPEVYAGLLDYSDRQLVLSLVKG